MSAAPGTADATAAVPSRMARHRTRGWHAFLRRPVVAVLAVTALAAFLRFFGLTSPGDLVFDEAYYPKAGCILIGGSDEMCRIENSGETYWREQQWDVGSWVHPPLGKWQIGLGIKAFGMDPFGWRVTSALAGTLVVAFAAMLAWVLLRSVVWVYVAGLLLATEHLNIVMSRTALLDVHLELWVVLGFLLLALDKRWIDRRRPPDRWDDEEAPPPRIASPVWRPWRFASGVAFGAALSVKWSGAMALIGAIALTYAWETVRRHRDGTSWGRAFARAFARETFGMVLAFGIVPAGVFMLTWLPWLHHFGWDWGKWVHTQAESIEYHRETIQEFAKDPETGAMTPTHPYYSRPWQWFLIWRPTSFWTQDLGADIREILAIGNPAVFWGAIVAIPWAAVLGWRRRDWTFAFPVVAVLSQYVPWLFVSRPTFFFYALPLTPFMVLAIVAVLRELSDATLVVRERGGEVATDPETGAPAVSTAYPWRPFVWIYLIVAVGLSWWFWPVLTGGRISDLRWHAIVWFVNWI
ncbi:MAG TPA: phospholipid carrier-dependent glycosyltransferase, partial [Actinomycetota bacterium]